MIYTTALHIPALALVEVHLSSRCPSKFLSYLSNPNSRVTMLYWEFQRVLDRVVGGYYFDCD